MRLTFAKADNRVIVTLFDDDLEHVLLVAHLPVGAVVTAATSDSITWLEPGKQSGVLPPVDTPPQTA